MLYDLHNPTRATRIIYDTHGSEIRIVPGGIAVGVSLPHELVQAMFHNPADLQISQHRGGRERPANHGTIMVDGMYGIGDNIHQRAVMRELMKHNEVWLQTCHWHIYHDLVADGLHLIFKPTKLRAQAKTVHRESGLFHPVPLPGGQREIKLWYRKDQIDIFGSILQSMAGTCGVDHQKPLDFTLPIPDKWSSKLPTFETGGKPIMIYRPIVLRREWNSANRNPEPNGYMRLYEAIREQFYTISLADIEPGSEWIVGPEAPADLKLHGGELDFPTMAALFKRAALVYCNAGFAPVLAQAVGTPSICVYGGRESFQTTQRAGEHLAPTLGINPIKPCDCHSERHDCGTKEIDIPIALDRVRAFAEMYGKPREPHQAPEVPAAAPELVSPVPPAQQAKAPLLVFGTVYVDCKERQQLTEQWLTLHSAINPDCDLLLIDSASPMALTRMGFEPPKHEVFDFGNNIGHLSRKGRDGWGRAFCKGLELAIARNYEYVVHIEGDSLLRVPVRRLVDHIHNTAYGAASIPVHGMHRDIPGWVETGLMVFKTRYLRESSFVRKYDWPRREVRPTPELIVSNILGPSVTALPIKGLRGDKNQVTHQNILGLDLDWVTHCHNDIWVYDRFVAANLPQEAKDVMPSASSVSAKPNPRYDAKPTAGLKLNLGCGTNKLEGWENHDADVDITKRLPWADASASFVFIEHCVEHVSMHEAVRFFEEAYRVLMRNGVLRVTVPSIEQILDCEDQAYFDFTAKWSGEATAHGAAKAILFSHGHQMAWTTSLLKALLRYAGFVDIYQCAVGQSTFNELRGAEGHGKVIGERFNAYESLCVEAVKRSLAEAVLAQTNTVVFIPEIETGRGTNAEGIGNVAVVVGGANGVNEEVGATRELLGDVGATWFVINDMLPKFPWPCIAVSLHPQKLPDWLGARRDAGYPAPAQVWAHSKGSDRHPFPAVTHVTDDWRGSSGLFAVAIARQLGFERIILCGVPMDAQRGHFLRGPLAWGACTSFQRSWEVRHPQIASYVRSWSGWTAKLFGKPDAAFLGMPAAV